jgi:hypothetical protein
MPMSQEIVDRKLASEQTKLIRRRSHTKKGILLRFQDRPDQ